MCLPRDDRTNKFEIENEDNPKAIFAVWMLLLLAIGLIFICPFIIRYMMI